MTDLLLENENARRLVKTLGSADPGTRKAREGARGPYEERPARRKAGTGLRCGQASRRFLAQILTKAGAYPSSRRHFGSPPCEPFVGPGEAWARRASTHRTRGTRPEDASASTRSCSTGPGSRPRMISISSTPSSGPGCAVSIALAASWSLADRRIDARKPVRAATRAGLEGFTRSLAKEIGANGSICQQRVRTEKVRTTDSSHSFVSLLSPRSAYISCQPFHVTKDCQERSGRSQTRTCSVVRSPS